MTRLTSKGGVVLLSLLGAAILLVTASRVWVNGRVDDAVLQTSSVQGTGSEIASGVVALALAGAAAGVAATTSGRVVRRVVVVALALAAIGAGVLVGRVLLDPSAALGPLAARSTGRTGSIETSAAATAWPWLSAIGVLLLFAAAVAAWAGAPQWRGLSTRYDAPAPGVGAAADAPGAAADAPGTSGGQPATGTRGQRVVSDWEKLSAGEDPTTSDPTTSDQAPTDPAPTERARTHPARSDEARSDAARTDATPRTDPPPT